LFMVLPPWKWLLTFAAPFLRRKLLRAGGSLDEIHDIGNL
jgi:hypothetical protein